MVKNLIDFAVHQADGANDVAARRIADGLVAKADAQQRQFAGESLDGGARDSRFFRRARAGRDDQVRRILAFDFVERDLVVAMDFEIEGRINLAEPLHEVVGERIVVVDQEDHGSTTGGERIRYDATAIIPGKASETPSKATIVGGHPWACQRFIKAEARPRINRPLKSGKPFTAPECR